MSGEAHSLPTPAPSVGAIAGSNAQAASATSVRVPLSRDDVLERLATGITDLKSSDAWKRWLDVARRLPSYSFNNVLLLALQTNGAASHVAGYRAWLTLGRQVRRSERALWVIAPVRRRRRVEETDDGGEPGDVVETIVAWKPVPVFDISATDGPPLPAVPCHPLEGNAPPVIERLETFATELGYSVTRAAFPNPYKYGETMPSEHRIVIREGISDRQVAKTLCHELAHCLLHTEGDQLTSLARGVCELEAESVAYVCLADLGIDASAYSLGYVASWTQSADTTQLIRDSGERILTASRRISERLRREADTPL